jgi:hypothetical protein
MRSKTRSALLWLALMVLGPSASQADDPELNFDIFIQDSCLTVWLDLAPLLNARALDRLESGVDLVLECRAALKIPRRLWGDRNVTVQASSLHLSYRKITKEYLITFEDSLPGALIKAESMPVLYQFLRDSVTLRLSDLSELDPEKRYTLDLRVTSISLTDFNLAEQVGADDESDSPLRYLFHQFLKITDYGRREYSAGSRPFALSELETID